MSDCFLQPDFASMDSFPEVMNLVNFEFRNVGLIRLHGISLKMPSLEVLDVSENKIFEVETVDELAQLSSLLVLSVE